MTNALEAFWNLYGFLIYQKYYYDEYLRNSSRYEKILNIVTSVASSASIASWLLWQKYGVIWAVIVAISQIINIVKPYFRLSEHVCLLTLLQPELAKIVTEMGVEWDMFTKKTSDKIIFKAMGKAEKQFNELEARYIVPLHLSTKKKCQNLAEKYRDNYLDTRHKNFAKGEDTYEQ